MIKHRIDAEAADGQARDDDRASPDLVGEPTGEEGERKEHHGTNGDEQATFCAVQLGDRFEKDAADQVTVVHCEYLPETKSGTPGADSIKVKGNIHWVSVAHAYECEVRLYDRLFKEAHPGEGDKDFLDDINADSVSVIRAQLEPSLKDVQAESRFQF